MYSLNMYVGTAWKIKIVSCKPKVMVPPDVSMKSLGAPRVALAQRNCWYVASPHCLRVCADGCTYMHAPDYDLVWKTGSFDRVCSLGKTHKFVFSLTCKNNDHSDSYPRALCTPCLSGCCVENNTGV